MLHFVYLIFGNNTLIFRLFSVLAIAILGILGFTHIRKDFGDKVGIFFSFLTYFLPVMTIYSQEIRMYSWACLFVALMVIYAYRFYKDKKIKNLVIFGIFSIACCYIHYYALATAGFVNLILLIYLIRNSNEYKKSLIAFLVLAVVQVVLYIPWLIYLLGQVLYVGADFWIKDATLLDTIVGVFSFQYQSFKQSGVELEYNIQTIIAIIVSIIIYIYMGYSILKNRKNKEEIKPCILSLVVYWGVIAIVALISTTIPILFPRYLMVLTGIYIFSLAFILSKENNKWIIAIACIIILALGITSNVINTMINYDSSNMKQIEYLQENIEEDDIIIYSNIGNGGVIAAFFPENKQYFYNEQGWRVEEAYEAYGPAMETIYDYDEILTDYHGRIWLIDSEYMGLWEGFPKEGITVLKEAERFDTAYQEYIYNIILLEKE